MDLTPFACSSCGECCRVIPAQLGWVEEGESCPMLDTDTKRCKIYEHRPPVCRIQEMYEDSLTELLPWNAWRNLNANVCNQLQEDAGMDSSFRVPLVKIRSRRSPRGL